MNGWVIDRSSVKPMVYQKLNEKGDWIIRKNITQEFNGSWVSEAKIVKEAEKNAYEASIDGATTPIEKTEKSLDSNDTTLMEALADIYEAIEQLREEVSNG